MTKKFTSFKQYSIFLEDLLKNLKQEYNICIHQIFLKNKDDYKNGYESIVKNIFKLGLHTNKYATIYGTLYPLGTNKNYKISDIINYCYTPNDDIHSIIFILPKNIKINDKILDFSSLNLIDENLCNKIPYNKKPDSYFAMHNILDITKGYQNLPKQFALAYQHSDLKNGIFEIEVNENFFDLLPASIQQKILQPYAEKFLKIVENSNAGTFQELLIERTQLWHKENEETYDDI